MSQLIAFDACPTLPMEHEPPAAPAARLDLPLGARGALPCLIRHAGPHPGERIDLRRGDWLVGRGEAVALRIEGHGISRRHAGLSVTPDGVVLNDLGSANGTWVNDLPVNQPVLLQDGDVVRFANAVYRFHDRRRFDRAASSQVQRLASVDPGTGVSNRRHLQEALHTEFARARRDGDVLALLWCELDRHDALAASHGAHAADAVLRESAMLVKRSLRQGDSVGRWASSAFVVLARDTEFEAAFVLAERLRVTLADHAFELDRPDPGRLRRVTLRQTLSIGVATLQPTMRDEHDLLATADRRLAAALHEGGNRVVAVDARP